jgi:hypothetical protein
MNKSNKLYFVNLLQNCPEKCPTKIKFDRNFQFLTLYFYYCRQQDVASLEQVVIIL